MVDILLEIDPGRYAPHATCKRGTRVLCVHILKAIYGMLMPGLLLYNKFRESVEEIGHEVNPCNPCVANKMVNGRQHTILWHANDLKSSHVDPKVNDAFCKWIDDKHGDNEIRRAKAA